MWKRAQTRFITNVTAMYVRLHSVCTYVRVNNCELRIPTLWKRHRCVHGELWRSISRAYTSALCKWHLCPEIKSKISLAVYISLLSVPSANSRVGVLFVRMAPMTQAFPWHPEALASLCHAGAPPCVWVNKNKNIFFEHKSINKYLNRTNQAHSGGQSENGKGGRGTD